MTEKSIQLDSTIIQVTDEIPVQDREQLHEGDKIELSSDLPKSESSEALSEKDVVINRTGSKYQRRSTALRDNLLKRKQQMRSRKDQS